MGRSLYLVFKKQGSRLRVDYYDDEGDDDGDGFFGSFGNIGLSAYSTRYTWWEI